MMADPIPLIERGLIVALMGWMAWRQHRRRDALRALLWAQAVTIGNKLATLEQVTGFDIVSGLRGQRWFESSLAFALRGYSPVSTICIDLDGIKALNLTKGHQFVDGVIRNAAMAIRTSLRSMDVTASIGVAVHHADRRMSAADLERAAELEMDRAKESGRNCVRPVIPDEVETAQQRSRRTLRATRYRLKQRSRAVALVPAGAADAIPEEIAADATERIEIPQRYVAA